MSGYICEICKKKLQLTELENISQCPHCMSKFHNNHLQEYLKGKGDCPICHIKITTNDISNVKLK